MATHKPFEHIEQRAVAMDLLRRHNKGLKQALDAIAEIVKDEPEAKIPNVPTAVTVARVIARLRATIASRG